MKAQKLVQLLAVLALSACHMSETCTLGNAEDCASGAVCYVGNNAKEGDKGVCVHGVHAPAPLIIAFSPLEAAHGAELRIEGANFSADAAQNSVTLNGIEADILSATETEMRVRVPKNMQCSGLIEVRVGDETATSARPFTYVPTAHVSTFVGDGTNAVLRSPRGIVRDAATGNFYVTDSDNNRVRRVSPDGVLISTWAGSGTPGNVNGTGGDAQFSLPIPIIMAPSTGHLYLTDASNHSIRSVTTSGTEGVVSTFAGSAGSEEQPGNTNGTGSDARFRGPFGLAIDAAEENLYVADTGNHCIRRVTVPGAEVSTIAGRCAPGGVQDYADGHGTNARFTMPWGIAADAEGNLYVTESNRLRKLSQGQGGWRVSTLAHNGQGVVEFVESPLPTHVVHFDKPTGIALDAATGSLYVSADAQLFMLSPTGVLLSLAGSELGYRDDIGANARFNILRYITLDAEGNLYVADTGNNRIRKIVLE